MEKELSEILNPEGLTFGQALNRLKSQKQKDFVLHWLKCFNLTQAAEKAGYKKNANCAYMGWQNSKKPNIQLCMYLGLLRHQEKLLKSADDVLRETGVLAFSSLTDYVSWKDEDIKDEKTGEILGKRPVVSLKDSDEVDPVKMRAVKKLKVRPGLYGNSLEIDLHDKVKPLELLGKHLKIWEDKLLHSVDPDDPLMKLLGAIDGKTRGLPKPPPED